MARIKQLLAEGKVVRMFGLGQLQCPKLVEIIGEHGQFDALWLDFEHGGLTMKDIELATMAARSYGMDHFVRLPATDYATVMRPLEAGAGGVMFSMVRSPAEVEQAVRWAKFWPEGERGLNGGNRDGRFGLTPLAEYTARQRRNVRRRPDRDRRSTRLGRRHRCHSRCRPPLHRSVRLEPGPGRDRRLREPQVP